MFNVDRPHEIPASLLTGSKYDGKDVYDKLKEIFYDKCYICETKKPQDINIEHFDAHQKNSAKRMSWSNLYFVCSRCNNIKGAVFNDLLDCCDPNTNVFLELKHMPPASPNAIDFDISAVGNSPKSQRTAELLKLVFNNDKTVNKGITAAYLREKVFDQIILMQPLIIEYFKQTTTAIRKKELLEQMKLLISREAPYSAFTRQIILHDSILYPLLANFMD